MKKVRITSFLLSFVLLFSSVPIRAETTDNSAFHFVKNNLSQVVLYTSGYIGNTVVDLYGDMTSYFRALYPLNDYSFDDWIKEHFSLQSDDKGIETVVPDDDAKTFINLYVEQEKESAPYKDIRSTNISRFLDSFEYKSGYDAIAKYLKGYGVNWVNTVRKMQINDLSPFYTVFPEYKNHSIYFVGSVNTEYGIKLQNYFCPCVDWLDFSNITNYRNNPHLQNKVKVTVFDFYGNDITDKCSQFIESDYEESLVEWFYYYSGFMLNDITHVISINAYDFIGSFLVDYEPILYRRYDSMSDLKQYETGTPFYYQYDVDTLPVLTTSNSSSYIGQVMANTYYNGSNYYYFTNVINNNYPPNPSYPSYPSNPSNPGSPINPDNPSNPSNPDDDDDGFDWGFLGGIGEAIGKLIQFIGGLIADIVSALTDVFTSVTELIPSTVISFFSSMMAWVPPEIWTIVKLAMVLGLVVALIKAFR